VGKIYERNDKAERQIAEVFWRFMYPRFEMVKRPEWSSFDFIFKLNGLILAAIEIKDRRRPYGTGNGVFLSTAKLVRQALFCEAIGRPIETYFVVRTPEYGQDHSIWYCDARAYLPEEVIMDRKDRGDPLDKEPGHDFPWSGFLQVS
jgi:hypothetical protein